ncbi:MAG: 2-phosphosulfolactate phosphatase [Microbacterium sp.]|uniref:2-phosphosulfolactate phosphatase n=1 Tax=Microbacterium sp. TaxID=51671 RepID=UPI0039E716E2
MSSAYDQSRYQVRFEWGAAGLARLAPAEVVVVVDVLLGTTTAVDAGAAGDEVPLASLDPALAEVVAAAGDAVVLLASLRNASAVAREVLAEQERRAARTSIAVIAVGDGPRFAVEDQFGAGAVIDALTALGIDHTSPEAAGAGEAFHGLRRAMRHLLTASASGQELLDGGRRDEVLAAAEVDAVDVVPARRGDVFACA